MVFMGSMTMSIVGPVSLLFQVWSMLQNHSGPLGAK